MIDFLKGAWWTLRLIGFLCAWVYFLVAAIGEWGIWAGAAMILVTACTLGGVVRYGYEKDMKELK